MVPFAPGGSSTIVARSVATEMEKALGQSIIIENKGGGGGNPAMQDVARADPDGYTLLITHIGSLALNPYLYSNLPFDVNRDFVHISLLAKVPNIFVVHESVPAKDAREFVALAKKEPGQVLLRLAPATAAPGHLAMEYFKLVSGIELQHVPYKGTGPNLVDLVAGRTHATSAGTPPLMPHVKAGKLRVIGVGSPKRLASIPDAPTIAEQGFAGFETSQWYGLSAPAKTPARGDPAPGGRGGQGGEEPCGGRALQGGRRRGGRLDAAGVRRFRRQGAGALERRDPAAPTSRSTDGLRRHRGWRRQRRAVRGAVRQGNGRTRSWSSSGRRKKSPAATRASPPGLFRLAYNGAEDLKTLIPDLSAEEIANTDFGTYTEEQFLDDMARVTEYRCDPDLTEILVKQSLPTAQWMRKRGVRFTAAWGRQAFKIGGKFKFWGGLTVEAVGGGPGLVESRDADREEGRHRDLVRRARARPDRGR